MDDPVDQDSEAPSKPLSVSDVASNIALADLFGYGGLALVLIGYGIYSSVTTLWQSPFRVVGVLFGVLVVGGVVQLQRDLRKKVLSLTTKVFLVVWAAVTLFLVLADLVA